MAATKAAAVPDCLDPRPRATVEGWCVDVLWYNAGRCELGIRFRLGARVFAYALLQEQDWPNTPEAHAALDAAPWVDAPPARWDIVPLARLGWPYMIDRQEAAQPRTKRVRAKRRK